MAEALHALVLVGPMGAGKSSLGRKAARLLERPFIDTDAVIAREHGPIPQIFAEHGEARFRELERDAVAAAVATGAVVALGGGAVVDELTRERLAAHDVVLLTVHPRVVSRRIAGGGRPLLAGEEDPLDRWIRIRDERWPLYQEVADLTLDTSKGRLQDMAQQIADWASGRAAARDTHA